MNEEEKKNGGISVNIEVGKELGSALGDVLRDLLSKPASALGELSSDAIGILGDRIKRKRRENARFGLESVRRRLKANGVEVKDVSPLAEEELHLLVEGLSLSGEAKIRELWAGLFAKAIEPDSSVMAERSYISVLQAISFQDAKIIEFLAFVIRTESSLRRAMNEARASRDGEPTLSRSEVTAQLNKRSEAIQSILDKADELEVHPLTGGSLENLFRLGLIKRARIRESVFPDFVSGRADERSMIHALSQIQRHLGALQEATNKDPELPTQLFLKKSVGDPLEVEVEFTPFGRKFASACGLI